MTPSQAIAKSLAAATAITAIVPAARIYHGDRPQGDALPALNYYELPGGIRANGFERITYSFNCRATTAATALQMAREVANLFGGTSSNGTYGYQTGFEITRASIRSTYGLLPEPDDKCYNAPVDILFVYPSSSVS